MDVPSGRQQAILAALLLDANRVVGLDQLIDLVWSDDPPATARTQIQICISALRRTLQQAGHEHALVTRRPGYLIQVPDERIDARLFESLVQQARRLDHHDSPDEAARILRSALALWRGPALDGIDPVSLRNRAVHLDESRLSAVELLADKEMQLGDHHAVIGTVGQLVEENPLRERLRGQLITALYRSGRQAEALKVYQDGRRRLIDELGIEPGRELQELHGEILTGVAAPAHASTAAQVPQQRSTQSTARQVARPYQLPADTADFTGRDDLVASMTGQLGAGGARMAIPVVTLIGKPGIGKSALGVHVAHLLREHYPDGQLYCELGGTMESPVALGDALGRFVRALGVPGAAIPDSVAERGEMYRTLISERRVLVVLDDAASEQQVRALVPGTGSCGVIVTSRTRLTGLAGATAHELEVLDIEQSRQLLANVIGAGRVNAEPAATEALVRMVGGLPLALRIVAARLAARPHWPLAWMLERLTDERRRLDELAHGEMMVRASLAMSYDGLPPGARRLMRLLSMVDASSYPTWVAAALLGVDTATAIDLLELLVDVQMLEMAGLDLDGSPRYRFHVIIRLFAHDQLMNTDTPQQRQEAAGRLAAAWLAMTDEAHRRSYGGDYTALRGTTERAPIDPAQLDRLMADPLDWLEAERVNASFMVTLTADQGAHETCWDLALSLVDLFESRCYFDDWESTHLTALKAVTEHGNLRGEAALRCSLGSLHLTRGRQDDAERVLRPALAQFTAIGDHLGSALTSRNLAWLDHMRGDQDGAADGYRAALASFEAAGDPIGRAHVLGRLAQIELDGGAIEVATAQLSEALELCRAAGNDRVETQIRYRLSVLAMQQGRFEEADRALSDLLAQVRSRRDVIGQSRILQQLGIIRARTGRWTEAERLLQEAMVVREQAFVRPGPDLPPARIDEVPAHRFRR